MTTVTPAARLCTCQDALDPPSPALSPTARVSRPGAQSPGIGACQKGGGSRLRPWMMATPGRSLPVTGGRPEGSCLTGAPEAEDDRAGEADQRSDPPGNRRDRRPWLRDARA